MSKAPYERPWLAKHFEESRLGLHRLTVTVNTAISAINALSELDEVLKMVPLAREVPAGIRKMVDGAKDQVNSGNVIFNSLAIVGYWSALEHCITGLVHGWIQNEDLDADAEIFQKIKLSFSDMLKLDEHERATLILNSLQQLTNGPLKHGVNKFEVLLKPLGLDGESDRSVCQLVFEFQQVRNVIAHKNGICDSRFVKACPGHGRQIGDAIAPTLGDLQAYGKAALIYMYSVYGRCLVKLGAPPDRLKGMKETTARMLSKLRANDDADADAGAAGT